MRLLTLALLLLCLATACGGPSEAEFLQAQRERDLAGALYNEGNIPGAVQHVRRALELDPEYAEAHLLYAWILYGRRDLNDALNHAQRTVDLLVQQQRQGSTLAVARNLLGVVLIELERPADAIAPLELSANDAMNTQPHLAFGNLGLAQLEAGQHEEAILSLQESVARQARFCVGFHRLGRAYFELERFAEAETALTQSLEADESCTDNPALQNAWRLRGETRAQLERASDATADFERCVSLGADTPDGSFCQRLLDTTDTPSSRHEDTSDVPFNEPT